MNATRWMHTGLACSTLLAAALTVQAQERIELDEAAFGSVSGKLTLPDGKPGASMIVKIAAGGPQAGRLPKGELDAGMRVGEAIALGRGETIIATTKTDALGQFSFKKVQVGTFKAVVPATMRTMPIRADVTIEAGKNTALDLKVEARTK